MARNSIARYIRPIIVTLAIACAPTLALAGGSHGGGGNAAREIVADAARVKSAIGVARVVLPLLVRTFIYPDTSWAGCKGPGCPTPLPQYPGYILTRDRARTEKTVAAVHWQIKSTGPCHYFDSKGNKILQDGSGSPMTSTICLSVQRLVNDKIPDGIVDRTVISLAFREFSHLLGSNEAQAAEFQSAADAQLRDFNASALFEHIDLNYVTMEQYWTDITSAISASSDELNIYSGSRQATDSAMCQKLVSLYAEAKITGEDLIQNSEYDGLVMLSQQSLARLYAIYVLLIRNGATAYCGANPRSINDANRRVFHGRPWITFAEYEKYYPGDDGRTYPVGPFYFDKRPIVQDTYKKIKVYPIHATSSNEPADDRDIHLQLKELSKQISAVYQDIACEETNCAGK